MENKLNSRLISQNNELIKRVDLNTGDLMVFFSGGHSYKILENGTQVLEVKNGPYTGLDDRVPFDDRSL